MSDVPDPKPVLTACVKDLLQRGVPPLAMVEAMIEINHGLIHEAERREKIG
jgi:hypothetical protein